MKYFPAYLHRLSPLATAITLCPAPLCPQVVNGGKAWESSLKFISAKAIANLGRSSKTWNIKPNVLEVIYQQEVREVLLSGPFETKVSFSLEISSNIFKFHPKISWLSFPNNFDFKLFWTIFFRLTFIIFFTKKLFSKVFFVLGLIKQQKQV